MRKNIHCVITLLLWFFPAMGALADLHISMGDVIVPLTGGADQIAWTQTLAASQHRAASGANSSALTMNVKVYNEPAGSGMAYQSDEMEVSSPSGVNSNYDANVSVLDGLFPGVYNQISCSKSSGGSDPYPICTAVAPGGGITDDGNFAHALINTMGTGTASSTVTLHYMENNTPYTVRCDDTRCLIGGDWVAYVDISHINPKGFYSIEGTYQTLRMDQSCEYNGDSLGPRNCTWMYGNLDNSVEPALDANVAPILTIHGYPTSSHSGTISNIYITIDTKSLTATPPMEAVGNLYLDGSLIPRNITCTVTTTDSSYNATTPQGTASESIKFTTSCDTAPGPDQNEGVTASPSDYLSRIIIRPSDNNYDNTGTDGYQLGGGGSVQFYDSDGKSIGQTKYNELPPGINVNTQTQNGDIEVRYSWTEALPGTHSRQFVLAFYYN
ncbi:hypothetical protein [Lelliottia wanjuensis]|uniref:hypothetical protein n=1 Tax=Lelliottia wanjuensis TaxID=3050585 RepID=UPI00254E80D2|nr:hypothetical protein [Lelliottia sp. V104_15]MDK9605800.1 hypothetical protein [Lelliottia sp. V104_15]